MLVSKAKFLGSPEPPGLCMGGGSFSSQGVMN